MHKHRIDVSPEMLAFVGSGPLAPAVWPDRAVILSFGDQGAPRVTIASAVGEGCNDDTVTLVLVVAGMAISRLFGIVPHSGSWYLSERLRGLVVAIRDVDARNAMADTLRLARSIELLCMVFEELGNGTLIATDGHGTLGEADARRIAAARRLIDERWQEKLTLDAIARACGLNRGKLTRGFRAVYGCTVADALTERRLEGAQRMLRVTDLPVSAIGYRCGYLNNASFARAFSRYVGEAPTRWRAARGMAA